MNKLLLYVAWVQAFIATTISLYYSEILQYPPCQLCWYQRICMYPIVLILAIGILRKDSTVPFYVLPFSIGGGTIAFYHTLLQYNVIESTAPCLAGISCTTKYINYFGFITIPLLSLIAFCFITFCMIGVLQIARGKKSYE